VENHGKDESQVSKEELALRLSEHVQQLEEKALEVVEAVRPVKDEQKEIAVRTIQVQEDIVKAREAILKDEYELVLTLARNTNETLKVLYGEIYQIYTNKIATDVVEDNDKTEGEGEAEGENVTIVEEVIKPIVKKEVSSVEEVKEFEVGIE
jgi:hypothetical protein